MAKTETIMISRSNAVVPAGSKSRSGTVGDDTLVALLANDELVPTRLGDRVLARLSGAIADGRLKPGDPIPSESSIATAFGVSKQIAREVIRELAAMGVIHVQQGKTSRVRAVDGAPLGRFFRLAVGDGVDGLVQAVELRRILEPGIAQLAATRRSAADLAALRAILTRMQAALGDAPRWIEADLDFHRVIAGMSGNRLIELQLEALEPVIRRMMERFNQRNRRTLADWQLTWTRHDKVYRAIEKGGARQAAAAMTAHFEDASLAISEVGTPPEAPSAPPPKGGAASGRAKPDPRRLLGMERETRQRGG